MAFGFFLRRILYFYAKSPLNLNFKKILQMKPTKSLFFTLALFLVCQLGVAQTVEEIISNYFENTGGIDNWNKLEGIKMSASMNQGGMEIPLEIYQFKDGRQMQVVNFQGKKIKQGVYDGERLWSHNFLTMEAEESDAEATANFKLELNDFPDSFLDYKNKGYLVELLGTETFDGTDTFKVKLVKEPLTIDGEKVDDISFYYFDMENFVLIAMQSEITSGEAKGMISEVTFSDYQEIGGLYFPFSMTQGVKDQPGVPISMSEIVLNPKVDDLEFKFPVKQ